MPKPTGKDGQGEERRHVLVRTPIGGLLIVATAHGVVGIYHENHEPAPTAAVLGSPLAGDDRNSDSKTGHDDESAEARNRYALAEVLDVASRELDQYFRGTRRYFDVTATASGTNFQLEVWQAVAQIPFGERRSYRDVATALGNPRMGRAIGAAVRANPLSIIVPGHRVVSSSGGVIGYAAGGETKRVLLDFEQSVLEHRVPWSELSVVVSPPASGARSETPEASGS